MIGVVAALLVRRRLGVRLAPLALYFTAMTASHGVLDARTNGGPGVASSPLFDDTRSFFPRRPIPASPLASRFFSEWGWRVIKAEMLLIWLPTALVTAASFIVRGRAR